MCEVKDGKIMTGGRTGVLEDVPITVFVPTVFIPTEALVDWMPDWKPSDNGCSTTENAQSLLFYESEMAFAQLEIDFGVIALGLKITAEWKGGLSWEGGGRID